MTFVRSVIARGAFALLAAVAVSSSARAQADEPRVEVEQFVVTGNTLLPAASIDAALAPFRGRRTLAELESAAQAVQALYRDAGYGSVIAYVPPQSGAPGRATIAVLEGRLSQVLISGNRQFDDAGIRRALPALREGQTPRVRQIDSQVRLANENPARQIALSLEPGAQQGDVEARLTITEQPATRWTLGLDNTGNAATGRLRASLGWQNLALWGLDHQLSVQAQIAPDKPKAVAVVSASYRVPFYAAGLMLDVFGAYSDVDGGTATTQAGPLQFSGKGQVLGLRLNKSLERVANGDQRLSFGFDRRVYDNNCTIVGLPAGACGSAGASVAVHPVSVDYAWLRDGPTRVGFNVGYSRNLDLGGRHARAADFDAARPGARVTYDLVRFGASGALALPAAWELGARLGGQWTRDALVAGEQFGIAGAYAVRGYDEREIVGDRGLVVSAEVSSPNLLAERSDLVAAARLIGFVDAGQASNRLGTVCRAGQTRCSIASAGVGVRVVHGALQLRLDVGHALRDAVTTSRGDTRAHLQALYAFY